MTQQEIQERNKQIALMLGKRLISKDEFNMLGENAYTGDNAEVKWGIIEHLAYHRDYNWLMEAVEFIEDEGYGFEITKLYFSKEKVCQITDNKTGIIISVSNTYKLKAVFTAVSNFAKFYNKKKQ